MMLEFWYIECELFFRILFLPSLINASCFNQLKLLIISTVFHSIALLLVHSFAVRSFIFVRCIARPVPSVCQSVLSFVRSFVRSIVRLFVRSCVRAFVCSCVRLFVPSFFRSFVRSLVRSYVKPAVLQSVVRSFARSLVRFSLGSFKLGFTSAITFTSTSTSARESVNTIILISSWKRNTARA